MGIYIEIQDKSYFGCIEQANQGLRVGFKVSSQCSIDLPIEVSLLLIVATVFDKGEKPTKSAADEKEESLLKVIG